jgi:hypothetical protein
MSASTVNMAFISASFPPIFDALLDHFIAYAHQVDLSLNGTLSSNQGTPFPVGFASDPSTGPCAQID